MRILVVEDDLVSRRYLAALLAKLGHQVITSENGKEAYDLFQIEKPQIVISDWMMPEMDGPALCKAIRSLQLAKYPYLILLTVLTGKKHFLEGMDAGADDFLTKPLDSDQLSARLRVAGRILTLQDTVGELAGMLPICASCKNVRDDEGYWKKIELYFMERSDLSFTHGICPDCMAKLYPGVTIR